MKAYICILLFVASTVSAQYFSANDGINLPRNGKRSYLSSILRSSPSQKNSIGDSTDNYSQTDKLSYRKMFNHFGKRNDESLYEDGVESYPNFNINSYDEYLIKEILFRIFLNDLLNRKSASNLVKTNDAKDMKKPSLEYDDNLMEN